MSAQDLSSPEGFDPAAISLPPTKFDNFVNRAFRGSTVFFAWGTILLVVAIIIEIGGKALPAIGEFGTSLITSTDWDASHEKFGILPEIWGTLYSSVLGLIIGSAFGVAIAIFLSQDFLPPRVELVLKNIIELLAAIPSVVYGLWGIFVVIPLMRPPAAWLHDHLGQIPFFSTQLSGPGMLPAALVLSIMILPTISAISRDALVSVPPKLKEASLGLGATKWETILAVILPTAATGIFGSMVLGFGRALGETMALAMLVGNSNQMSLSLFSPGNTLAALLANHFPEATKNEVQVLMYAALVLLIITLLVNFVGAAILNRAAARLSGVSK
jgi:phosphate transport system permease protein